MSKERPGMIENLAEVSKKLDNVFIVTGLGMMVLGFIALPALLIPGAAVAGGSVATKWGAEKVRQWAEKKRKKKRV